MNPQDYWQERKKILCPDDSFAKLKIKEWSNFVKAEKEILAQMSMSDALDFLLEADERMAAYPAMIEVMQAHLYAHIHHHTPLPEKVRILLLENKLNNVGYFEKAYAKLEFQKQRTKELVVEMRKHLAKAETKEAFRIVSNWASILYRSGEDLFSYNEEFSEVLPSVLAYFAEKDFFASSIVVDDQLLQKIARHLKTVANPWKKYANADF